MTFRASVVAILLIGALLGGCGFSATTSGQPVAGSTAAYLGMAVLHDGSILLDQYIVSGPTTGSLSIRSPGSSSARSVPFPVDRTCAHEIWLSPTALGDDRVAFVRVCVHPPADNPSDTETVAAVDPATGEADTLWAIGPLGEREAVTLAPEPDRSALYYDVDGPLCTKLLLATDSSPEQRVDWIVTGEGRSFRLDQEALGDCSGARAGYPALSPDGRELAFLASPATLGAPAGPGRLDIPWDLFITSLTTPTPRELAQGLTNVGPPKFSPDGSRILMRGGPGQMSKGLSMVSASTGKRTGITGDEVLDYGWTTSGDGVFALRIVPTQSDNLFLQGITAELVEYSAPVE